MSGDKLERGEKITVHVFRDLQEGDMVNYVAMHPLAWAKLRFKYKMSERDEEFKMIGLRIE